ncbi:MAG: CpsD/CapB family tyrosine-protein kinase [Acidimicrobiales bacterium]|nr:CpsD/CapB family tyrosine-protein kinase [Acidimicrobiales bacterium]
MEPQHYLRIFRRFWPAILAATLLGALIGWFTTPASADDGPANYWEASATLITPTAPDAAAAANLNLGRVAFLVSTGDIPTRVEAKLGRQGEDLGDQIYAEASDDVGTLIITALSEDRDEAVLLADAFAEEVSIYLDEQADAGREVPRLQILEPATPAKISRQDYLAGMRRADQRIVDPTASTAAREETDGAPSDPSPSSRAFLGGVLGLLFGVGAVITYDRVDTRLRTKEDVEKAFGLPVLAEVPPMSRHQARANEIAAVTESRGRAAEAYRALRTAITFVLPGVNPTSRVASAQRGAVRPNGTTRRATVVLVTSPEPNEGKTTTVANLAAVMAEAGDHVLVVNCDFRRPRVEQLLPSEQDLVPSVSIGEGAPSFRATATAVPGVRLVTASNEDDDPKPAAIIAAQRRIIEVARSHFDFVLLDTAPLLTTNDAAELLPEADLVVLVARCSRTRSTSAETSAELLERLDAPVLGVLFNASAEAPAAQYYYYYVGDKTGRRPNAADETIPATNGQRNGSGDGAEPAEPVTASDTANE